MLRTASTVNVARRKIFLKMCRLEIVPSSRPVCRRRDARSAKASVFSERRCSSSSVSCDACIASVSYRWIRGFRSMPKASLITPPYRNGKRFPFAELFLSISSAAERRPRLRRSVLSSRPLARSDKEAFDGKTTVSAICRLSRPPRLSRGRKLMSAVNTARSLVVRPSCFLRMRTGPNNSYGLG